MSVHGLLQLRRVTSSGRFIPEIDGLRFVAIMSVLLYHLRGYLLERGGPFAGDPKQSLPALLFERGNYGVQLFFVISGFILALPFASHRLRGTKAVSLKAYFLRRLTRLEPPYIISMLLFFALLVVYVHESATVLAPHLAASLLYVHNIVYGGEGTINPVAWSLEVEIQFYILVPVLARLFAIRDTARRRSVIVGLIVMALLLQTFVMPSDTSRVSRSVLNYLQFFLFGFLLADVYLVEWRLAPEPSLRWDVVSLAGWPLLPVLWTFGALSRWAFPVATFVLYCAAFRGRWSRKVFSLPLITTIGGMCYTTYLLHYQIISFIGRYTVRWRVSDRFGVELLWQLALLGPVILLVCAVYFVLIERPCMRPDWPQRLAKWVRERRPATTVSPGNVDG
jgi:peptidoglycan/LPS O-acetylase OafA/YrhL